jgi:hypothetical protein
MYNLTILEEDFVLLDEANTPIFKSGSEGSTDAPEAEASENKILRIMDKDDRIHYAFNCGRVLALDIKGTLTRFPM